MPKGRGRGRQDATPTTVIRGEKFPTNQGILPCRSYRMPFATSPKAWSQRRRSAFPLQIREISLFPVCRVHEPR